MLYICIFPGLKGNHIHPKQSWVAYFGALQSAGIGTKHGLLSVRTPLMNTRVSSALPDTFYSALGVALESKGTQSKQQPNLSAPHRLSSALLCASGFSPETSNTSSWAKAGAHFQVQAALPPLQQRAAKPLALKVPCPLSIAQQGPDIST